MQEHKIIKIMSRKKIILAILILATIGAFVGYKMYNKPHINVLETSTDINITANKIIDDFSSDENTANTKYLDKIIEVKGLITSTKIDKEKGIVILHTNDDFGSVICHLSEEATKKMSSLKLGQTVTLKGICTGFLMDVILVKCEILTN